MADSGGEFDVHEVSDSDFDSCDLSDNEMEQPQPTQAPAFESIDAGIEALARERGLPSLPDPDLDGESVDAHAPPAQRRRLMMKKPFA